MCHSFVRPLVSTAEGTFVLAPVADAFSVRKYTIVRDALCVELKHSTFAYRSWPPAQQ